MGGAVAERLLRRGHEVAVFDLDQAAIERLVALGAEAPDSVAGWEGEALVVSLPDDAAVHSVLIDGTALDEPAPKLLVELSTILPATMEEVAVAARSRDVAVLDAPVSGGPNEARAGELTLLVGAEDEALAAGRGLLEDIGSVEHVGPAGHGKAAKLVNNTMTMGNMAVAAEAFTLGVKMGLDPRRLYDVISRSGGRSHHFEKRIPYVLEGDFTARFALGLSEKDLRLALQMGHDASYPMPLASSVHQVFEQARARGLSKEDMVAVIKVYEEWSG
jgi:3-hydroxyisobutyrate dehydrogenase